MVLPGSVPSLCKRLTPPWLPVQYTLQTQCCCGVTDRESSREAKRVREAGQVGSRKEAPKGQMAMCRPGSLDQLSVAIWECGPIVARFANLLRKKEKKNPKSGVLCEIF